MNYEMHLRGSVDKNLTIGISATPYNKQPIQFFQIIYSIWPFVMEHTTKKNKQWHVPLLALYAVKQQVRWLQKSHMGFQK